MRIVIVILIAALAGGCATSPSIPPMPKRVSATCPKFRSDPPEFPVFPRAMLRAGVSGWVILEYDVGADGAPKNIRVAESSHPGGMFEVEALRALQKSRFRVDHPYEHCLQDVEFNVK